MNYDKLDDEELLRLSLDAINNGRDADALVMLKTILERDDNHIYAKYLLAAQHAQLGLYDRAEAGFRDVVVASPEFAVARFQLGQLLVMKGDAVQVRHTLAPLADNRDALGAYARAMLAAANDDAVDAARELEAGLSLPQELPALAADMQRLLSQLRVGQGDATVSPTAGVAAAAPIFLTGYGREG